MKRIEENEVSINEIEEPKIKMQVYEDISNIKVLTHKEAYLLDLHYKYKMSYIEISKITGEKVATLKQRINRAILKF